MTSRVRRIVLAMYGHKKPQTDYFAWFDEIPATMLPPLAAHGCYEAMDDPEPYQDVNPSDRIADAPPVITGGNFGMPCA